MRRVLQWISAIVAIGLIAWAARAELAARRLTRAIAIADSANGVLAGELEAQRQRVLATELRSQVLAGVADELERRMRDVRPQLQGFAQRVSIAADTVPSIDGDTTTYIVIRRKGDPQPYRIPKFIMDDAQYLLRSAFALDSAWRAERMSRLFLQDTLVPDVRRQLVIADSLIASQRKAIDLRDQRANPRCGTKCKVLLGAAGGEALRQLFKRWTGT